MSNPCVSCTRPCCHHYVVTIHGYDAWIIARGLRLAPEQFLAVVRQQATTERGFRLDRSDRTYEIALAKKPAKTRRKPCVFWYGLPGGGGRCGIYALRPHVCQTYPAVLRENQSVRREDVLCPSTAWRDDTLAAGPWRDRLVHMRVETDIYQYAVARWNEHVLATPQLERISLGAYYAFLMAFYDRLAALRANLSPADWCALAEWWVQERTPTTPLPLSRPTRRRLATFLRALRELLASYFTDDVVVAAAETPA